MTDQQFDALVIAIESMQGEIETRKRVFKNYQLNGGNDESYYQAYRHNVARLEQSIQTIVAMFQSA